MNNTHCTLCGISDKLTNEIQQNSSKSPQKDDEEVRFCSIIEKFCGSLINFATYVRQPAKNISTDIQKKNSRNMKFDLYVENIENFNNIMHNVIHLLKKIIISLNVLFVDITRDNLIDFLNNLKDFLVYLVQEEVFDILIEVQKNVKEKYKYDTDILDKIKNVKYLVFRMFSLSIDITTLILPQIIVVKEIVTILEKKTDEYIADKQEFIDKNNTAVDNIVKQLMEIQMRSDIISSINEQKIMECLQDRKSKIVLRTVENLHTEYIELMHVTISLKNDINTYKKKKNNILVSFLQKLLM